VGSRWTPRLPQVLLVEYFRTQHVLRDIVRLRIRASDCSPERAWVGIRKGKAGPAWGANRGVGSQRLSSQGNRRATRSAPCARLAPTRLGSSSPSLSHVRATGAALHHHHDRPGPGSEDARLGRGRLGYHAEVKPGNIGLVRRCQPGMGSRTVLGASISGCGAGVGWPSFLSSNSAKGR